MTRQKSFKRLVRARMDKTGESYTAARAALLAAEEAQGPRGRRSRCRTRRSAAGPGVGGRNGSTCSTRGARASARTRRSRRWVADELGIDGWGAQAVTVSYERARSLRAVGRARGRLRDHRLEDRGGPGRSSVRRVRGRVASAGAGCPTASCASARRRRPKSARFDWGDGETRVIVGFEDKGPSKSIVGLEHERLPDGAEAERMKAFWRERVAALKELLER